MTQLDGVFWLADQLWLPAGFAYAVNWNNVAEEALYAIL